MTTKRISKKAASLLSNPQPVKLQVRLPGITHHLLKQAAKFEGTSMNALIIRFVRDGASKAVQKHLQQVLFEAEQSGTGLFAKPKSTRVN